MTNNEDRVSFEKEIKDVDLQQESPLPRNLHNKKKISEVVLTDLEIQAVPLQGHDPDE